MPPALRIMRFATVARPIAALSALLVGLVAAMISTPAFAAGEAAAGPPPAAAQAPAPDDESAARERIRVLRAAAESGKEGDIDALVAFLVEYVGRHPASPLTASLRRDLPRSLKAEAHRAEEMGMGRRALALYRIYDRLPFLPPDRGVTRRRAALESAFVAAHLSPAPRPKAIRARAGHEVAIPVEWADAPPAVSGEVHFRNRRSAGWRTVAALPGPAGSLRAFVPAEEVVPPAIEYWLETRDASGAVHRTGSPEDPLIVRVAKH